MAEVKKNVKQKLLEARKIISNTKMKKGGVNKFSNYNYFTPDQVSKLVGNACIEVGLLPMFSLKVNDTGYFGELVVYDTESEGLLTFSMVTDIPEIKATNSVQRIGGSATYTQRYLEMSAFGIVDNNLDFDSQDNRNTKKSKPIKKHLSKNQVTKVTSALSKIKKLESAKYNEYVKWISTFDEDQPRKDLMELIDSKK